MTTNRTTQLRAVLSLMFKYSLVSNKSTNQWSVKQIQA